MTNKTYNKIINEVTDMESFFFEKKKAEQREFREQRKDKMIEKFIVTPFLIFAVSFLIANLLLWH